jgi:putative ABC transport system permease protein
LIVLSENAAHRLGLHAGDSMSLATPAGFQSFGVRAVVVDYTSELGAGFIDRTHYMKHWHDPMVDAVNVYAAERTKVGAIAVELRKRLGGQSVFVTTTADLRERFIDLVHEAFAYSESVEIITLLIALMGVIGTMMAAVLDRVGEIGMLRAVGARRAQVLVAIVIEAAFLGLCATTAGVISGAVQCILFLRTTLFANTGWHLSFAFPFSSTLRITLLVILTAALAGLIPGLRAARLNVKDALGYE